MCYLCDENASLAAFVEQTIKEDKLLREWNDALTYGDLDLMEEDEKDEQDAPDTDRMD